jgi:hypothetical protein
MGRHGCWHSLVQHDAASSSTSYNWYSMMLPAGVFLFMRMILIAVGTECGRCCQGVCSCLNALRHNTEVFLPGVQDPYKQCLLQYGGGYASARQSKTEIIEVRSSSAACFYLVSRIRIISVDYREWPPWLRHSCEATLDTLQQRCLRPAAAAQGSQPPPADFDQLVEGPWPISTSCPPRGPCGGASAFWREIRSKLPLFRAQIFDQLVEGLCNISGTRGLRPQYFDPSMRLRALPLPQRLFTVFAVNDSADKESDVP